MFDASPIAPAFCRIEGRADARLLVVCDHASAVIPACYGDLGLSEEDRRSHIAWDIGAAAVTRLVAARFACPALLSGVSRLVVDCNRAPGDAQSIPALTCGVAVPGNRHIAAAEAEYRLSTWFHPYHAEIAATVSRLEAPVMVSIHSFTPEMAGRARPWHVGVLSNRDRRMADPALAALSARQAVVVGDNQPYSGREINHTLDTHAGAVGLPHVSFELRQDLIADVAGVQRWAGLLADVLEPIVV
jgi:predicted N-formylglutamate amidohydrolase